MKKILVVDDDKDLLMLLKAFLRKDYETRVFDNATDGRQGLIDFHPDLVILDVNIGPDDGRVLCSMIKQHVEFKGTPVILISGDKAMLANNGNCDADQVLQKPFEPAKLLSAIAGQLKAA